MTMQDKTKVYDGVVSGVTEWGIFVEIVENKCEGMVRISDLQFDQFDYLEQEYCIVGRRTNTRITFGDKVKIRLKTANLEKRTIDFVLEELPGRKIQNETRSNRPQPERKSSGRGKGGAGAKGGKKRRR